MKYLMYISILSILTVLIGLVADIFVAFSEFIVAIAYGIKFTNMEVE